MKLEIEIMGKQLKVSFLHIWVLEIILNTNEISLLELKE